MDARRVKTKVIYNNRDISGDVISLSYTDNTDQTDDISITLADRTERWFVEWFPETGDSFSVSLELVNWNNDGKSLFYDMGRFEVDSVSMSSTVSFTGVSAPITGSIRSEEKNKGWEKLRLSAIAKEIAENSGLILVYESDTDPFYDRTDQNYKSDLSFLEELCKSDGLCVKVYNGQLIIFNESKYDLLDSIGTVNRRTAKIKGFPQFKRNAKNIYSACEIAFTDSKTDQTFYGRFDAPVVGNIGHVLKLNESFNSETDDVNFNRKARARLREQNKNEWTVELTMVDGVLYYAGTNLLLDGWYRYDGKYHIKSASYCLQSSGFQVALSMRRCLEGY